MKSLWVVEFYYQNKFERRVEFDNEEAAIQFYKDKLSAIRLGLVGWSISYPIRMRGES